MLFKIIILVIFFASMILIGILNRKKSKDVNGFLLGGRNVGAWLTAFAYGTSYFSAVIFIGYAGQFGWKFGVASTWIGLGNAFIGSLLAWIILGRRTRIFSQHISSATMPDFFGKRYDSSVLRTVSAAIIFVFLIPYTASLYNGLSRLFSVAFNVNYIVLIIIMAVLTCIYVVAGGYKATAITDFIQGIIMLVGIVAVVLSVLSKNGGFTESLNSLAAVTDETVSSTPGIFTSFLGPYPLELLSVIILTSLGTWGLPQMVQKFYAIKDEKAINRGTIISTVFALIVAGGCYFLGGFGRLFVTNEAVAVGGYDSIIPSMVETLPDVLIGIVIILVLSASMSTLSSLVLASSSTLTIDIIDMKGKLNDKTRVLLMRIFVVFFVAVSAVLAILQYKSGVTFIAQLMGISWGVLAGAFLAPFIYGLYWKRTSKAAVWTCFIISVVVMTGNIFFKEFYPSFMQSPINCGTITMLFSLIVAPIISIFTKAPDKQKLDDMFACYERKVTVSSKHVLSGDEKEQ